MLAIASLESKEILGGPRLAEIATDLLQDLLDQSNRFTVVERRNLARVVDEQALDKAGKLVGADLVAYGAVTETVLYSETVPNGPRRFAEIVIQARVVRTDTGKIVYSGEKRGLSNVPQPARASKPEQIAFDEALLNRVARDAVEKLAQEIAELAP